MTWQEAIDGYIAYMAAAGSTRDAQRVRRHHLKHLRAAAGTTGPWDLKVSDLVVYLGNPGWKPETRKSARTVIRGFYRWAEDLEMIEASPARRLPPVRVPATVPKPTPTALFADAMKRADERERLMLLLGARAGLRRAEIATLHANDIQADCLRITGKGGRTRHIPLDPSLAAELAAVAAGGWLFPGQEDGHLSPGHVGKLLQRLLGCGFTGHSLRHLFASKAYAGTRDLLAVQALLGHTKPETTMRYTALPDGALVAAVRAAGG